MYGNNYGYYNPQRYGTQVGVPQQPINNQYMQQPIQPMPTYTQTTGLQSGLQGKIVDNIEVVKATDIPMDGSVSYFPTADGSTIITKKLGMNGTSEIQIYKPVIEEPKSEQTQVVNNTNNDEIIKKLDKLDNSDILESLLDEIKDLKDDIKDLKDTRQKVKEK